MTKKLPTPLEIRLAINEALSRDAAENPERPIPARAYSLISKAIADECDRVKQEAAQ